MSSRLVVWCLLVYTCWATIELPKFASLKLLYPKYPGHGGQTVSGKMLRHLVEKRVRASDAGKREGIKLKRGVEQTALRLSYTLNRYGGRHAIGHKTYSGPATYTFIRDERYFSPYLALRYGDPQVLRFVGGDMREESVPLKQRRSKALQWLQGRQGIVHVVAVPRSTEMNRHRTGRIALWDCTEFYGTPDWTASVPNLLSVEIWQTHDSHCHGNNKNKLKA